MSITLEELASAFLADNAYQSEHRELLRQREATLPRIQAIIQDFLNERTHLPEFREQLLQSTRQNVDVWFAQGRFGMEINKLVKNHNTPGSGTEDHLRSILSGLDAPTMGQRVEQFYHFVLM